MFSLFFFLQKLTTDSALQNNDHNLPKDSYITICFKLYKAEELCTSRQIHNLMYTSKLWGLEH